MSHKSNDDLIFTKDDTKSYVYVDEGDSFVGILAWDYDKKKWVFEDYQDKGGE